MPGERIIEIPAQPNVCAAHRLHCQEWGDAANPRKLLCVHALTRNARDFDFLAGALASSYHVLCPDMPGRGQSPWLENKQDYTYATYLHDILTLARTLDIRSADWVGTSMGGIIGMMLAAMQPELIRRLAVNDIGALVTRAGLARIASYVERSGPFNTSSQAQNAMRERFSGFGIREDRHWRHMFAHGIRQAEDRRYYLAYDPELIAPLRRETNDFKELEDILLWDYWKLVQCPALLLRGADSDILSRETAEAMVASHADCRLIEYPGAAHAPALMETSQIEDVRQWLLAD